MVCIVSPYKDFCYSGRNAVVDFGQSVKIYDKAFNRVSRGGQGKGGNGDFAFVIDPVKGVGKFVIGGTEGDNGFI